MRVWLPIISTLVPLSMSSAAFADDEGGEGCRYLWYFVSVSPSGAASTPGFGSCGNTIDMNQVGPLEPIADQQRAAKEVYTYTSRRGTVTESGKYPACR